jgi:hypothetical protein
MTLSLARLAFLLGIGAVAANADITETFNINFTTGAMFVPTGTFTYDLSNNTFTAFNVVFDSISFDLLTEANAPLFVGANCGSSHTAETFFTGINQPSQVCGSGAKAGWAGSNHGMLGASFAIGFADVGGDSQLAASIDVMGGVGRLNDSALGAFTVTAAAVPEPNIIFLTLAACGAMLIVGKRRAAPTQIEKG